jgi:hypothetical protein
MPDYKDVWHRLINDPHKSWVVFENGTCVILMEPSRNLAQQAQVLLSAYGSVSAGSASGDFSVLELGDITGWVVGGHHPDILNYVAPDELIAGLPESMQAGLIGQQHRSDDAEHPKVVYIYDPNSAES